MKILITESQKKALDELQWQETVTKHVEERRIPMTPKIYQLISGKERVRSFHISDVHQIMEFGKLKGTKKTISTFTFVSPSVISELDGIQTKGGVLYEIWGDLVVHSPSDLMSRPDENGIRWLDSWTLFPDPLAPGMNRQRDDSLNKKWKDEVVQLYRDNNVDDVYKALTNVRGNEKSNLIRQYFKLAEKFVNGHVNQIRAHLIGLPSNLWNEVLVNNIEIHDVFWSTRKSDELYEKIKDAKEYMDGDEYKSHIDRKYGYSYPSILSGRDKLSERELNILNNYPAWLDSIQKKLESISTGTVYKEDLDSQNKWQTLDFVRDRGGFLNHDQYKDEGLPNQ